MTERGLRRHPERQNGVVKTAAVLIIKEGQILGIRHGFATTLGEGVIGIPAGRQQDGGTEKETALRELEEETGLKTKPENLIEYPGNYVFVKRMRINGGVRPASLRVFLCTDYEGELRPEATGDTTPQWIPSRDFHFLHHTGPNISQLVHNGQVFLERLGESK